MKTQKSERGTYDRGAVGLRLRKCRKQEGWSRGYVAEKIGIVEKYYADIERGTCGMSIETMMALAQLYHLSLDEFIFGPKVNTEVREEFLTEQLMSLPPHAKECCAELVCLFIKGMKQKG